MPAVTSFAPADVSSGMMAGVRRDRVRRDRVVYAMSAGKKDILESAGINTRLGHLGNDPLAFHGFVNPPVVHASTVLFPVPRN